MNAKRPLKLVGCLLVAAAWPLSCGSGQAQTRPAVVFAGSGTAGFADGPASQAQFSGNITGLGADADGNVYVADAGNYRIRKVSLTGQVSTLAGNGAAGFADGPGEQAQFSELGRLAVDGSGNCYVLEREGPDWSGVCRIRKIAPSGQVTTFYTHAIETQWPPMELDRLWLNYITIRTQDQVVVAYRRSHTDVIGRVFESSGIWTADAGGNMADLSVSGLSAVENVTAARSSTLCFSAFSNDDGGLGVFALELSGGMRTLYKTFSYSFDDPRFEGLAIHAGSGRLYYIKGQSSDRAVVCLTTNGVIAPVYLSSLLGSRLAVDDGENVYVVEGSRLTKLLDYAALVLNAGTDGGGTVAVDPTGPYYTNTVVRVTAMPLAGWTFQGWSGDAQGTATNITLVMDANKTVKAIFAAPLTITPSTGGTVSREPDQVLYPYGTQVSLTAHPDTGFEFIRWSDGVGGSTRTVTVTSLLTFQPVFTALPQFTLSASVLAGVGGTVERQPDQALYYRDTVVKLTARPAAGYVFQTWLDNVQANPRTVVISSNVTLFAVFAPGQPQPPVITVQPQDATVVVGHQVQFTVAAQGSTPLEHQWQKDGVNIAGASDAAYVIAHAALSDAGNYRVVVRNTADSVSSSEAVLTVETTPPYTNRVLLVASGGGYVQVPDADSLDLSTNFTLEAWINTGGSPVDTQAVIAKRQSETSTGYRLGLYRNRPELGLNDSQYNVQALASEAVLTGSWHHISGTFDGQSLRIYVDGNLGGVASVPVRLRPSQMPLDIGQEGFSFDARSFIGMIDEARVWNRARSETEIRQTLYCRLAGTEPGLVAYWTFDNGNGQDQTVDKNDGTMVGGAAVVEIQGQDVVHSGQCGAPMMFDVSSLNFDRALGFECTIVSLLQGGLRVEVSTDLLNWVRLADLTSGQQPLDFKDLDATNWTARFYRARLLQ